MIPQKPLNDSKLIQLLRALSAKEMKRFEDYLRSPFFNKNEKVLNLFLTLKKGFPRYPKIITKTQLYQAVLTVGKSKKKERLSSKEDQKLRQLMNSLTNYIQDFLIQIRGEEKATYRNSLLLESILYRKLYRLFPSTYKNVQKIQEEQPFRDNRYFRRKYLLEESELHYDMITNNRAKNTSLQNVIDNLHYHFLADQLRYFCAAINRENILDVSYKYPFLEEMIAHIEQEGYEDVPAIGIYYQIIMLLKGKEVDKHYQKAKEILKNSSERFPVMELRQMYSFVLNFCSNQIKKGRSQYLQEKFEIYNNGLSKGVWNAGRYFSHNHFILLVRNALDLGKIEWAKEFVENYQEFLAPKDSEKIPSFSRAFIAFSEENFDDAHNLLLQLGKPEDFYFELYHRTLIIQIYFERCDKGRDNERQESALMNAVEALRFYINRNMNEYVKNTYSNYVNVVKRLCRVKFETSINPPSRKHLQKLYNDIAEMEFLVERKWLLAKVKNFLD